MKVLVNGQPVKVTASTCPQACSQPTARGLEATEAAPITPDDIHQVIELAFTLKDVVKVLFAIIKGWFKKS